MKVGTSHCRQETSSQKRLTSTRRGWPCSRDEASKKSMITWDHLSLEMASRNMARKQLKTWLEFNESP
jgi:hypothetical protein